MVDRLADQFAARGHAVDVLAQCRRAEGRPPRVVGDLRVEAFPDWLNSRQFGVAPGLWRRLHARRGGWDVVHAHSFHSSVALAAAALARGPLVFSPHYHGTGHTRLARAVHKIYDPLAGAIFRRADAVLCVSKAEEEAVTRDYPVAAGKTVVVHNGVDVSKISAACPFSESGRIILVSGRLERYKNIDQLVRATALLDPDHRVVVTGDGSDRPRLEALAHELGLSGRISFLGRVPDEDLYRWQRTAHVAVSLSDHEAFGLSLLESYAAGARLVASDIPAHREVFGLIGAPGVLVPTPLDAERVARAISEAASAGQSPAAESDLSWANAATKVIDLYERLT